MMGRVQRAGVGLVAVVVLGAVLTACGPVQLITYRVATRGPVTADVGEFERQVASTLSDDRGWSLGGPLVFEQTAGPADLTIWLSTAGAVPSFSSGCSAQWSCRAGANVVINEDRWLGATSTWPFGLGSYRHYVVNHEVGHWLGLGHAACPGPGERAPVMVQQSKGGNVLGPCRFNVWPTEGERAQVASNRGVPVAPARLPVPDDPFGNLEALEVRRGDDGRPVEVRLAGWAVDGDTRGPLAVVPYADARPLTILRADGNRPDLDAAFGRGPQHGFDAVVSVPPETLVVCVDVFGVDAGLGSSSLGCTIVK
jgi:hypothetical protein